MSEKRVGFQELEIFLKGIKGRSFAIIGIGNPLRGDDAAGLLVASRLSKAGLKDKVIIAGQNPELHLKRILEMKPEVVVFIDAVHAGLEPGEVIITELPAEGFEHAPVTTHSLPLSILVEMLGVKSYLIGIQVENVAFDARMNEKVRDMCSRLADLMTRELRG